MIKTFRKVLDEFFFKEMDGYAQNTLIGYKTAINHFGESLSSRENFTFDEKDVLNYLNSDSFTNLEVSSQNLYKQRLKKFLKWYGLKKSFLAKIKELKLLRSLCRLKLMDFLLQSRV